MTSSSSESLPNRAGSGFRRQEEQTNWSSPRPSWNSRYPHQHQRSGITYRVGRAWAPLMRPTPSPSARLPSHVRADLDHPPQPGTSSRRGTANRVGLNRFSPLRAGAKAVAAAAAPPESEEEGPRTDSSSSTESKSEENGATTGPTSEEQEDALWPSSEDKRGASEASGAPPAELVAASSAQPPTIHKSEGKPLPGLNAIPTMSGPPLLVMADLVSKAQALQVNFVRRTFQETPPPERSEHVLWMGNVPREAKSGDVIAFFSKMPLPDGVAVHPPHGIVSVFVIARSKCAFVNWESEVMLTRALEWTAHLPNKEKTIFPGDKAALTIRRQSKSSDHHGGSGQHGRGLHVRYVREYQKRVEAALAAGKTDVLPSAASWKSTSQTLTQTHTQTQERRGSDGPQPAPEDAADISAESAQETTSSLLRHPTLRHRFFILKSRRLSALQQAVHTKMWATLLHNESFLDQAYRHAEAVFLFMSANTSGGFFGVARMAGPIFPERAKGQASQRDPPDGQQGKEHVAGLTGTAHTEEARAALPAPTGRSPVHTPILSPSPVLTPGPALTPTATAMSDEGSSRSGASSPAPTPFPIKWIAVMDVPFSRTNHIRNPWRSNRPVKVSRDGTEVEPEAGWELMRLFTAPHP